MYVIDAKKQGTSIEKLEKIYKPVVVSEFNSPNMIIMSEIWFASSIQ